MPTCVKSSKPTATGQSDSQEWDSTKFAQNCYEKLAKIAVESLMRFVQAQFPGEAPLCVTYFDEAHELNLCFWVLLRLLQFQSSSTRMWYVFLGAKSSISYYAPTPENMLSLKLRKELLRLVPPYIALDFDQHAIARRQTAAGVRMSTFETIQHLTQYGRPLWAAQLPGLAPDEIVRFASLKLTNGQSFDAKDKNHVFAVVSQCLCLDPVLTSAEAIQLADRSVAHHMRLLTGFSDDHVVFYTHSPSEPILVLGAIDILYKTPDQKRLGKVLNTLSADLCSAGLVDKGLLGEFSARLLLLTARDYAAPKGQSRRKFLKPVRLLDFLDKLFGKKTTWASPSQQKKFKDAFANAYVNFTHWIVTNDQLPEKPSRKLLTNLWTRGTALQCCFLQSTIDFFIVTYNGSVAADAIFDPDLLSDFAVQIKLQVAADTKAEQKMRRGAIPNDGTLPHLALLMELGTESTHQATGTHFKVTTPEFPSDDSQFHRAEEEWTSATTELRQYEKNKTKSDEHTRELRKVVKAKRLAMDACNRYSISVRGACPGTYGILEEADIVDEFATLLRITTTSPSTPQYRACQHMQPLKYLSETSPHAAWMS